MNDPHLASRKASLEHLKSAPSRKAESVPFWEWMINNTPIKTGFWYRLLLKLAGVHVGKNVTFLGGLRVKLRGKTSNINIGDNVILGRNVDLRNRENGKIILHERVYLDDNVRLVAARDGYVEIGFGSEIGGNSIINSGGITTIGEFCMISNNVNINSSSHGTSKDKFIKESPHEHGFVKIGSDVWLGGFATIVMNTEIGEGAVIGANSMARGELNPFGIYVGSPAKLIRTRE